MNIPETKLHQLIDRLTQSHVCFAIYRLPWTDEPILILQNETEEVETFEVKQANSLDANVSKNFVEAFPANVLKLPGEYRFCVDGAGSVRFVVLDNGTIVVSDS